MASCTPGPLHCTAGAGVLCVSLAVGASCYEAPPGSEGQGSQLQQGTAAANLCLEIRPTQLREFVRLEESGDLPVNQYFIPQLCYLSGVSAMPVISYAICDKSKVHSHQRSWLKAFCWLLVGFGPLSSSNWGLILWEDKILNVKYIWHRSFLEHRTKLQVREWRHISDLVGQSGISDICALQCCVCTNCPDVRVPCTFMCGISPVCFNLSSSSNQKLIT